MCADRCCCRTGWVAIQSSGNAALDPIGFTLVDAHCALSMFYVSSTGDLGTESDMCTVNTNLTSIFGDWACDDGHEVNADDLAFAFGQEEVNPDPSFMMIPEDAGDAVQAHVLPDNLSHADQPVPPRPLDVDMRSSVFVSGVLHFIHNCVKNFGDVLSHFKDFNVQLKGVSRLLSHVPHRRRWLYTCFSHPHLNAFDNAFDHFSTETNDQRWGTCVDAVGELLPLHGILRAGWNKDSYGRVRGVDGGDGDDPKAIKVEVIDEAI